MSSKNESLRLKYTKHIKLGLKIVCNVISDSIAKIFVVK